MFIEFQYPLQAPITNSDKVILAGNVSTRNGSGEGSISATFHRLASEKSWYQFTSSFGNGLSMGSTVYRKLSPRTFADMSGKTKTCFWKFQGMIWDVKFQAAYSSARMVSNRLSPQRWVAIWQPRQGDTSLTPPTGWPICTQMRVIWSGSWIRRNRECPLWLYERGNDSDFRSPFK